ncbi:MAG TPA: hypothetical protein VFC21_12615 [Bryobacteraceae bacterium]|nr:hypothetical protein [Bryobacteraceae bacterium]
MGADSALQNYLSQNLQQTPPLLEARLNGMVRRADSRVEVSLSSLELEISAQ